MDFHFILGNIKYFSWQQSHTMLFQRNIDVSALDSTLKQRYVFSTMNTRDLYLLPNVFATKCNIKIVFDVFKKSPETLFV